jgi:hypothetical protein
MDPSIAIAAVFGTLGILLPGAAVLAWQKGRRSELELLSISLGLGLAVIAIGAVLGRLAGLQISLPILVAVEILSAAALVIGLARRKARFHFSAMAGLEILVLTGLIALRFFQARNLALPAWVDSVHHAFLVRLFLEQGGIPVDLQPWIPGPFYYHIGFHASAAVFAALAGFSPDRAILIFGQILNAAAALSAYRLSMAIRPDRRLALLVMALVGFFSQMPAFYLSWGRYTLLAGMVLIPLAMAEAIEFAARPPAAQPCAIPTPKNGIAHALRGQVPRISRLVRLALLTAGLLLTHYLAAILLAVFLLLVGACILAQKDLRPRFAGLAVAVGAGTALALPWLFPMLRNSTVAVGVDVVASQAAADALYFSDYATYIGKLLGPLRNYILLGAGLLGAAAALFRRGPLRILAVWGLILGVQTLPWGLRIEPFRPDHLAIVLYLPAAVLAGHGLFALADWLGRRRPALRPQFFFAGVALAACLIGLWQTRDIVNPRTVFADDDDRRAAAWAAENTPAEAVFLINTEYWQNGLYRGSDGGWWLLPLALRRTLLPPMLYSFADRSYIEQTNLVAQQASLLTGCTREFWSLVQAQGVTHIYIKEGAGALQPAALDSCPGVVEIFRTGRVRIYRVDSTLQSGILPPTTEPFPV